MNTCKPITNREGLIANTIASVLLFGILLGAMYLIGDEFTWHDVAFTAGITFVTVGNTFVKDTICQKTFLWISAVVVVLAHIFALMLLVSYLMGINTDLTTLIIGAGSIPLIWINYRVFRKKFAAAQEQA